MYRHKLLAQNVDKIGCWSPDATVLTRFKPLKYSFMLLRHYFGSSEWVRILRPGMPQIAMQHSRWAKAKLPVHIPVQARGQGLQRLPNWPRWSDKEVVLNQGGRIRKSRDRGQRIWTLWTIDEGMRQLPDPILFSKQECGVHNGFDFYYFIIRKTTYGWK